MKKSKFLLLGSVSSLAAIPFIAAKCGDTKEEDNKKPAEMPGEGHQDPSAPGGQTNPSVFTTVDLSKLEQAIKEKLNKLAKENVKKEDVIEVLKTVEGLKEIKADDLKTVEFKDKKLVIEAKEGSKLVSGKYEFSAQADSNSSASTTVDLSKLEQAIKEKLNKLAKENVKKEDVIEVLKTVEGLKEIKADDLKTVEFKDKKLVIEAKEGSKLVSGKYEFSAQADSNSSASTTVDLSKLEQAIKEKLNKLAKENVKKEDVIEVLKTVEGLKEIKADDLKTVEFKDKNDDASSAAPTAPANPETPASTSKTDISKLSENDKNELSKQLSSEFSENPNYDRIVKALKKHFKNLEKKHILVQGLKDKLDITAVGTRSNPFTGTLLLNKNNK
ncbi:variable surface lipoprotein [Mycoplasmopsis agalactiae]|uniref:variable surface lipoprotein n=1 Tax=Mycoplasmopsis agalactiae TaxID=2110 RepID=UPI001F266D03|nr:variable surface lipoprotein [Mycoplasmopsis agalactiae]MCE6062041.1 variable surface lipoprotein [Mycoplasmopsis agalactiae]